MLNADGTSRLEMRQLRGGKQAYGDFKGSYKKEDCTNRKLGCCRTPRLVVTLGLLQEDGSGGSKPCSTPSEIPISWYWSRLTRLDVLSRLSPSYLTFWVVTYPQIWHPKNHAESGVQPINFIDIEWRDGFNKGGKKHWRGSNGWVHCSMILRYISKTPPDLRWLLFWRISSLASPLFMKTATLDYTHFPVANHSWW